MVSNAPTKGDHAATKICCFGAGAEKSLGAVLLESAPPTARGPMHAPQVDQKASLMRGRR